MTLYTDTRDENVAVGLYRKLAIARKAAAKAARSKLKKGKK